jgi:hypothetical protein
MSLNPDWMPEDDEDQKRKAAIEEMMRSDRARYFRDEPLQQEYRDILTSAADRSTEAVKPVRVAGPFDVALARFKQRRAIAENPDLRFDANDFSSVLDGGEAEAKSIFRRDSDVPDATAETFPDSGGGKGDRLPVSVPHQQPAAGIPDRNRFVADDAARAFESDTPFRLDGVDRVVETQGQVAKIRKGAIQQNLKNQLNYAAEKTGLQVEVHSGGQPVVGKDGVDRLGSPRHDDGGAADLKLVEIINGKKRFLDSDNPQDRLRMQAFIQHAVTAGATGIGHGNGYMGPRSIHIGGGTELVWGAKIPEGQKGARGLPWVADAHSEGLAARQKISQTGAWPTPTKPLQFATKQNVAPDFQDMASVDGRTLSKMRDMIDADMMLRKAKR